VARAPAASAVELAQTAAEHADYWTKYAFMFPVSVCVATTAMLTGIGGAALFSPIFLLGFPALGPEFPLPSQAEAFNVALLTECFGFTSGLLGYIRRGLVDWRVSAPFIAVGAPFGIAGGLAVAAADPATTRAAYGAAMLALGVYLFFPDAVEERASTSSSATSHGGGTAREGPRSNDVDRRRRDSVRVRGAHRGRRRRRRHRARRFTHRFALRGDRRERRAPAHASATGNEVCLCRSPRGRACRW
jgi:hypothetical protein